MPDRSGNVLELVWSTATTSPESSALRQVDRIDSHDQHAPATSPDDAASRISAVPL